MTPSTSYVRRLCVHRDKNKKESYNISAFNNVSGTSTKCIGTDFHMLEFRWCTPTIEDGSALRSLSCNMMNELYTKTTIYCVSKSSIMDI